jgi:hypothetical protein
MTASNVTYLYGLLHVAPGARRPSAARAPRGLPGARPVRLIDAGRGLWLIAADAPLARYGPAPVERRLRDLGWVSSCAMAHEAVVEHFGRLGTVVPMKLFTLFSSDARAVEDIRRARPRLDRLLVRLAGRQEWGVRLTLDGGATRPAVAPGRGGRAGSGTAFLLRKKAEQDAARQTLARAQREAERVYRALARRADDAHRRPPVDAAGGTGLLLDAAFLVPVATAPRFRAAAKAEAGQAATRGARLTLTGPWPPYSFAAGRP